MKITAFQPLKQDVFLVDIYKTNNESYIRCTDKITGKSFSEPLYAKPRFGNIQEVFDVINDSYFANAVFSDRTVKEIYEVIWDSEYNNSNFVEEMCENFLNSYLASNFLNEYMKEFTEDIYYEKNHTLFDVSISEIPYYIKTEYVKVSKITEIVQEKIFKENEEIFEKMMIYDTETFKDCMRICTIQNEGSIKDEKTFSEMCEEIIKELDEMKGYFVDHSPNPNNKDLETWVGECFFDDIAEKLYDNIKENQKTFDFYRIVEGVATKINDLPEPLFDFVKTQIIPNYEKCKADYCVVESGKDMKNLDKEKDTYLYLSSDEIEQIIDVHKQDLKELFGIEDYGDI